MDEAKLWLTPIDLGYNAVGKLNRDLDIVIDWAEKYRKGVIYCLQEERVCSVIPWNVWEQVEAARKLVAETKPFKLEEVKGQVLIT